MIGRFATDGVRVLCDGSRLLRLGGLIGILLLGGMGTIRAQVSLQLFDQVQAPGRNAHEGTALPQGTQVILLREPGSQPHTLENAGVSRKELAQRVLDELEVRADTLRLTRAGRTEEPYPSTPQSGQIYYVLARTPDGTFYESYVNTGSGFVPGFDAVHSGRMTMGPVSGTASERFAAAFRVAQAPGPAPRSGEGQSSTESGDSATRAASNDSNTVAEEAGVSTESASAGGEAQVNRPAAPEESGGWWPFLWGVGLGLILGVGAVWYLTRTRLNEALKRRDELRQQLRERRNQDYRAAAKMTSSSSSDPSDEAKKEASRTDEVERLQSENERLRKKTERLEEMIEKTKQYVKELRGEDD